MSEKPVKDILVFSLEHYGLVATGVLVIMLATVVIVVLTVRFTRTMKLTVISIEKVEVSLNYIALGMQVNTAAHERISEGIGGQTQAIRTLVAETVALREQTRIRELAQGQQLATILERLAATCIRPSWGLPEACARHDAKADDPSETSEERS